ncbi:MAG: hypothetical protein QJR06_11130 [Alicyclobacillaceae bacterium]|nr:hypothetical protein [Alicyclobacillaceae bacterium]
MVEETELSLCVYLAGLRRELGRMLDFCRSCMEAWDVSEVPDSNTRSARFVLAQGRCPRCWQQKAIERLIAEIERVQPAARLEKRQAKRTVIQRAQAKTKATAAP